MHYSFDTLIDRRQTGSLKWEKYAGKDIIPLWVADMDFESTPEIKEAIKARADHSIYGYTLPYDSVIESVEDYLKKTHNWEIERDWLVWIPGLVPALNLACRAYAAPSEGIMTAIPIYPPFLSAPKNSERKLITTPLAKDKKGRWSFDFDNMESQITSDTRVFMLSNPHNPVGRVFDREELTQLVDFCERHDLVLCSDEIHCDLILDEDCHHIPTATLNKTAFNRTVTMMAPSKTYNIPGMSCSFLIIPNDKLRQKFRKTIEGIITEINTFGYVACEAAYRKGGPWLKELLTYLRHNRDTLYKFIETRIPEIKLEPMEATYLAWLDPSELKLASPVRFFEDAGVGLSDGSYFGTPGMLRLNFACPHSVLLKGLERMENAVKTKRS